MSHVSRLNYLGGEFVKTSDFNLTELPLAIGSLPIANATVTLQDSPDGLDKIVLTLTSPDHSGFLQYDIYPKLLDVGVVNWKSSFTGLVEFKGSNHKEITYTYAGPGTFELSSILGRY